MCIRIYFRFDTVDYLFVPCRVQECCMLKRPQIGTKVVFDIRSKMTMDGEGKQKIQGLNNFNFGGAKMDTYL